MSISGHKTGDVFDLYHIVDRHDVVEAMRKLEQLPATNPVPTVKVHLKEGRRKRRDHC